MVQKTRRQLQNLFKQGAKPSGDDFRDFIESTFNIQEDGLEKPNGADAPLKVTAHGTEENLLDFYAGNTHSWRFNQNPSEANTPGLNIATAAGSSKLFIASSSGNLGVSTATPDARLHILQSENEDALRIDDAEKDTTPFLIDKDGKVGIGTSTPGAKLEVSGTVKATAFEGDGAKIEKLSASKITSGTLSTSRIPNLPASKIPNLSASKITSGTLAGSLGSLKVTGAIEIVVNNADSKLRFEDPDDAWYSMGIDRSDNKSFKLNHGGTIGENTHFVMTSGGKVGIGTANPVGRLDIKDSDHQLTLTNSDENDSWGLTNWKNALYFQYRSSATALAYNKLVIDKDGNVGIGTTSPTDMLQLSDFAAGDRYIKLTTAGANKYRTGIKLEAWKDNYGFKIEHDERKSGLNFVWNDKGDESSALFINNGLNVGIGTTDPKAKLDVNGRIIIRNTANKTKDTKLLNTLPNSSVICAGCHDNYLYWFFKNQRGKIYWTWSEGVAL